MGGGSSVMGMVALRGTPDDYAEWEQLGASGWGWNDVLPFFRKLEKDFDYVGAELHVWGPEFSGTAHVSIYCVSFDVGFGAGSPVLPKAISWQEFEATLLPGRDAMATIEIASGENGNPVPPPARSHRCRM